MLVGLGLVDALAEINSNARHDARRPAGPAAFDEPVYMATDQPDDLRVAPDQVGERGGLLGPAVAADIMFVDVERL